MLTHCFLRVWEEMKKIRVNWYSTISIITMRACQEVNAKMQMKNHYYMVGLINQMSISPKIYMLIFLYLEVWLYTFFGKNVGEQLVFSAGRFAPLYGSLGPNFSQKKPNFKL
jgi:hypothetical protein